MNLGIICNHSHIVYHAMVFTNSITSEDEITVIVKKLIMTGATQQDYTRSVANLARQVTNRLRCTNVALANKFTHFLRKTAVALFLAYWKDCYRRTKPGYFTGPAAPAIDPAVFCAFIGDLFSTGMLDFEEYERCVDCLFTFELSPVMIECFYAIFARGRVNRYENMTPEFLTKCKAYIEEQCSPSRGNTELLQGTNFTDIVYGILFGMNYFFAEITDETLDLEKVLNGSLCSPLTNVCREFTTGINAADVDVARRQSWTSENEKVHTNGS